MGTRFLASFKRTKKNDRINKICMRFAQCDRVEQTINILAA